MSRLAGESSVQPTKTLPTEFAAPQGSREKPELPERLNGAEKLVPPLVECATKMSAWEFPVVSCQATVTFPRPSGMTNGKTESPVLSETLSSGLKLVPWLVDLVSITSKLNPPDTTNRLEKVTKILSPR